MINKRLSYVTFYVLFLTLGIFTTEPTEGIKTKKNKNKNN